MDSKDYFYYNLILRNPNVFEIPANVDFALQNALINRTGDYNVSIIRFGLVTRLPLFFPVIFSPFVPNSTNISISFTYIDDFEYIGVVMVTDDEINNGIFSIGPLLNELNIASKSAYQALYTAHPTVPARTPPYFALDPDTQIVSMYVDDGWLETDPPTPYPIIYFNSILQSLLNFPSVDSKQPAAFEGIARSQIRVLNYAKLLPAAGSRTGFPMILSSTTFPAPPNFPATYSAVTLLQVEQEYPQPNNFIDIDRLLFTTQQIPVVKEYTPINPGPNQGSTTQSAYLNIITDFSLANLSHNFTYIEYLPTAEYRRISMNPSTALDQIDMRVSYTTFDGTIRQVFIPPGGFLSIKMMFERKGARRY